MGNSDSGATWGVWLLDWTPPPQNGDGARALPAGAQGILGPPWPPRVVQAHSGALAPELSPGVLEKGTSCQEGQQIVMFLSGSFEQHKHPLLHLAKGTTLQLT